LLFLEPKDYAARSLKGEAFHRLGDETRALEELSAALEMAPDDAITLLRRGRVREALGDKAAAAADKARALKLDPSLKTD
jgi:tetratricopeptide (TPR) repeat protein